MRSARLLLNAHRYLSSFEAASQVRTKFCMHCSDLMAAPSSPACWLPAECHKLWLADAMAGASQSSSGQYHAAALCFPWIAQWRH